jgi:hypothetical protein
MDHEGHKVEDDVSAWDASLCEEFCEFEAKICRKWFHCPLAVFELMSANVHTHGKTMHGIKYKVPGTRKSGDPFTSLFNSFWNALMHIYIIHVHNPTIRLRRLLDLVVMLVQGDDNAMSISHTLTMPDFNAHMLTFGFKAKCFIRKHPFDLEFCSNRLYKVKQGWTFGPKPGRVLTKFSYFINPPKFVTSDDSKQRKIELERYAASGYPERLLRGNALGLWPACGHIPILAAYMQHVLMLTSGYDAITSATEVWKMAGANCTPTIHTKLTDYHNYGWSAPFQRSFEFNILRTPFGRDLINVAAMRLYDRDTAASSDYLTD